MRRSLNLRLVLCAIVAMMGAELPLGAVPGAAAQARISEAYGKLPLSFEVNEGQVDKAVKFLSRGSGYTLFLTPTEVVMSLTGSGHGRAFVRLQLAGANSHLRMVGVGPLSTKSNYLLGNDPRQWYTGVPNYARVHYEDVYAGIDLVYRGNQQQLEYDLVIAPGADPGLIRLAFQGADSITIGARGELILHTADGDLIQHAPVVYQETGEGRQSVKGRYILFSAPEGEEAGVGACRQVGFELDHYDRTRPLVIDPVLVYSTFLGASGIDQGGGIAVDGTGNAYVTGFTSSTTFPGVGRGSIQLARGGNNDAFVTKINPGGTAIVYSTFLGGGGDDQGRGIAVDGAGNAYVTGVTDSNAFPGVSADSIQPANGGGFDAFVTKINPTGTAIVYSTFLGGSGQFDRAAAITVDGANNAYVAGGTDSNTFPGVSSGSSIQPVNGGVLDAFVTKINPTGTGIVYSTFLGGSGGDEAFGIAVDGAGNSYVTGIAASFAFPGVDNSSIQPAHGGSAAAFLTKINSTGTAIVYSTFLGGNGGQADGRAIAVDDAGNAYVTGDTQSVTFPGVGESSIQPAYGGTVDAFVTRINPTGTAIVYSTFLGGGGADVAFAIAADGVGNAYVAGRTSSNAFPGVSSTSIQPTNGGGQYDAFLTKINPTGTAIVYSTFLGGVLRDQGFGVAVDSAGNAYVTGITDSPIFPGVSSTSIQPANGGPSDAFVTKIGSLFNLTITTQASAVADGFISDTATLAGGANPAGTITFKLFGPDNASCAGTPIFTSTKPVNGNGNIPSDGFLTSLAGTYRWVATYSGDLNNGAAGPTSCSDPAETVVVNKRSPTITTQASSSVTVGGVINDTATLTGAASPTGNITFNLFGPNNAGCVGSPIFTSTNVVNGNSTSTSDSFATSTPGTYRWVASYSGDTNNNAVGPTSCADPAEAVIVLASGSDLCNPGPTTLCIDNQPGDHRFELRVHYASAARHLDGDGRATALSPLGITEGGIFSFFSTSNPEVLIKVLNGCGLGGHHWVFFAAATDVGFTVTARDTLTGVTRTYSTADGQPALPVLDTSAFNCP